MIIDDLDMRNTYFWTDKLLVFFLTGKLCYTRVYPLLLAAINYSFNEFCLTFYRSVERPKTVRFLDE